MRFRRLLAAFPVTPVIWLLLGTLSLGGCASSPSLSSADGANANRAYTRLGVAYLENNNLTRALDALDRAQELDDDNAETLQALAMVYQRQGEKPLAREYFRKAIAADPDFTRGRNNFAAFLYQQQDYRGACNQLEKASKDAGYEHRARLFTNLGQCYMALDETRKARESLTRASHIDPRHAASYFHLAKLELSRKRYDRADDALAEFFKLARPTRKALEMAVELAYARGDDALAADYEQKLERMNTTRP